MSEIKDGYIIDYISGQPVKETPEEIEAIQPFSKILVDDYGYPKEYIHTRPQYRVKVRPSDTKKNILLTLQFLLVKSTRTTKRILLLNAKRKIVKTVKRSLKIISGFQERI